MPVKHIQEITASEVPQGIGVTKKVLLPREEMPNFEMRCFILQPGGKMPNHTNEVEHEQYVINGRAKIGIGDEVFEVKKGNVVYIPAKVPHWYSNIGDDTFEFICLVPNQPDTTTFLK
jgi:quercetin dioxygenase-like cupin family protein